MSLTRTCRARDRKKYKKGESCIFTNTSYRISTASFVQAAPNLNVGDRVVAANGVSLSDGVVSHEEALAAISMSFGSEYVYYMTNVPLHVAARNFYAAGAMSFKIHVAIVSVESANPASTRRLTASG